MSSVGAVTAAAMLPSISRAAASSYSERWIPRGSHKLYARDYPGSGPAFVMLHGFPDNLKIYDDLAPTISAAGRRVITFDFLGYGKSNKPAGFASISSARTSRSWRTLTPQQKTRFDEVLQPIIIRNFATGSGEAFVAMAAGLRANAGYNTARVRLMRSFTKPVNFVWGSSDPYANRAVGEELAAFFPAANFVALPLGHWLEIDSPADVARAQLARN